MIKLLDKPVEANYKSKYRGGSTGQRKAPPSKGTSTLKYRKVGMLAKVMAQRIERRKLSEVTPYPHNPRRHSDAQVALIAGSIAAFGFNNPILVDAKAGIIAGHGRYLAALKLGLETVPVVILDHLSETEKRAYILADNKMADLSSFERRPAPGGTGRTKVF